VDLKQDIHYFTSLCFCIAEIYFLCTINKFYSLRVMCCDILRLNYFFFNMLLFAALYDQNLIAIWLIRQQLDKMLVQ